MIKVEIDLLNCRSEYEVRMRALHGLKDLGADIKGSFWPELNSGTLVRVPSIEGFTQTFYWKAEA